MSIQEFRSSKSRILFGLLLIATAALSSAQSEHTIGNGETLYSIARAYGVAVSVIQDYNEIKDPRKLVVGQTIKIPQTYEVKKGDTLYAIAREFSTTVAVLRELNDFKSGSVIQPEQILLVPGAPEKELSATTGTAEKEPTTTIRRLYKQPEWPVNAEDLSVDDRLSGTSMTAKKGDSVVAIASGTVIWNAPFRGYGWMIIVESVDRYVYVYGGNEQVLVKVGDQVTPGMEIAILGTNPHSGEATLFFSVYRSGKFVDPAKAPRI